MLRARSTPVQLTAYVGGSCLCGCASVSAPALDTTRLQTGCSQQCGADSILHAQVTSVTAWRFTLAPAKMQQEVECPSAGRVPGDAIPAEHNMTYEACLRSHGRPLEAEFQSQCGSEPLLIRASSLCSHGLLRLMMDLCPGIEALPALLPACICTLPAHAAARADP